jgi:hypothetical protein
LDYGHSAPESNTFWGQTSSTRIKGERYVIKKKRPRDASVGTIIVEDHSVSTSSLPCAIADSSENGPLLASVNASSCGLIHLTSQQPMPNAATAEDTAANIPIDTSAPNTTKGPIQPFHSLIRWINLLHTTGIPDNAAPMKTATFDATVDVESATTENSLQVSTERRLPMWDPKYVDENQRMLGIIVRDSLS